MMAMDNHYHVEKHDDHSHLSISSHEAHAELSLFHYIEHIDFQKDSGILGGILLLLVLFRSTNLYLFLRLQSKLVREQSKTIFYHYFFADPPPPPLRSVLFHAPPQ